MSIYDIIKLSLSIILAVVPACIWGYIFFKKQVGQKSMTIKTFIAGALFVTPLLFYKFLWQYFPWINAFEYTHPFKDDLVGFSTFGAVPLDVILTFMIVGIIEELTKFFAIKATDKKRIASIDDAIEMAITAALGFAFAENILYFYNTISSHGVDGIVYPFIFRSLFSTFAHIMFSGVLGYHYGLALFATQELQEDKTKKRWKIIRWFSQILHFKKETLFYEEQIVQGVFIAVILHAIFNIFLEMNWTFLLVPYLTGGFIYLNYLLEKKEDHKVYELVDNNRNDLSKIS